MDSPDNSTDVCVTDSTPEYNIAEMSETHMRQALADITSLLDYARKAGIEVDEKSVQTIVNFREKYIAKEKATKEEEANFFITSQKIAKACKPVTSESYRQTVNYHDWSLKSFRTQNGIFNFFWKVIFIIIFILSLLLVLHGQIYFVIAQDGLSSLDKLNQEIYEKEKSIDTEVVAPNDIAAVKGLEVKKKELARMNEERIVQEKVFEEVTRFDMVPLLTMPARAVRWVREFFSSQPAVSLPPTSENQYFRLKLHQARIDLKMLANYYLPIFYGLLGCAMFIIRDIMFHLEHYTYKKDLAISYIFRLLLGALVGLAVGWFYVQPGMEQPAGAVSTSETNGLHNFSSPFVLAFVAGYSIEIVFSLMDRFVKTILPSESK